MPMRTRRVRAVLTTCAVIVATSAVSAGEAGAAEHVVDGSFDLASCSSMACNSPGWTTTGTDVGPSTTPIGPICGPATTNCANNGSGYNTFTNWARLGAGFISPQDFTYVYSEIGQTVSIPAGTAATLSFVLHMPSQTVVSSYLSVTLDGARVFSVDNDSAAAYSVYKPVVIDVSAFAGGSRDLLFKGTSTFVSQGQGFDVDNVSLTDSPGTTPAPASSTGRRAAALAKCKKKRGKARRKCKAKANLLPV
jgi:hypothetical protein